MVDVNDDAKGIGYRRVEVLTCPDRRRKWPTEVKAQIVAEAMEPGAVVADVARRWQVCPQQVFGWRREMRASAALSFVPLIAESAANVPKPDLPPPVELHLAGGVVRIPSGTDATFLTTVLRALRASAS
jgi:transposase